MRWRQSFLLLILGFILSMGLACEQFSTETPVQSPVSVSPSPRNLSASPSPTPLPAETQAILANVGALYDPPRGQARFAVISDLNSAYGSTDYDPEVDQGVNLLPFWRPDLVLCSGDMVAGQKPTLTPEEIQAMWASFDRHVGTPLRRFGLPFGFTVGNHDASSATAIGGGFLFQQERDLAAAYWNDPKHNPGVQWVDRFEFPFFYTFTYAAADHNVFFVVWDGSSSKIDPEKLAWVEQALASPKAQQSDLRIILGHLPLYGVAVGRDEPGEVMENAEQLQAMLEKYNVHTYISGHHHAYFPGHKGKMQLLHSGILGSGPRPLINTDLPPRKTLTVIDVNFDLPDLTRYTTYDMATLKPIDQEELPRFLTGHNGMVLRRDVNDLNALERSECEAKLGSALCTA